MVKRLKLILASMVVSTILFGCQMNASVVANTTNDKAEEETAQETSWDKNYDAEESGVLIGVDDSESTLTIKRVDSGDELTLTYTGGTAITDKYESVMVIDQVEIGELVNIYYNSKDSTVRTLEVDPEAWEYTGVTNLTYDRTEKIISISGTKYKYGSSFTIISNDEVKDLIDLDPMDVVTVKGYNKKICSIIVTQGHGYITLANAETFYDGWVEVSQESAKPITEDMIIVASEGNHKLTVAKDGTGGTKSITVKRGETNEVDVGDLKGETVKSGSLKFNIKPTDATLYINNQKTDYSELVVLEYGSYRVTVKASGYEDFSQIIVVGSSYAEIDIDMTDSTSSDTSTDTTTDTTGTTDTTTDTSGTTDTTGTSDTSKDTSSDSDVAAAVASALDSTFDTIIGDDDEEDEDDEWLSDIENAMY